MIYKLVNYQGQLDSIQLIKDNGEFWSIPINEANTDYQQYLKWVAEGNTPEPADEITE